MPYHKRIKALQTLIRAQQHEVDGLSAKLTALRTRQAEYLTQIDDLSTRRDREGYARSPETVPFVANFLDAIANEQNRLNSLIDALNEEAETLEVEVRERFSTLKTWQLSYDRLKIAQNIEDRRHENLIMDEIGQTMFIRRAKS